MPDDNMPRNNSNDLADQDDVLDFDDNLDMGSKGGAATQTSNTDFVNQNQSSQKGFTKMIRENPQKQKDIASKGGRAAHQRGTAHEWTSEEAKAAGRLGGRSKSQD